MKKLILLLSTVFALAAFTGCDEKAKLAQSLEGSWAASPEKITTHSDMVSASMIEIFEFSPVQGQANGTLTVNGLVSFSSPLPPTASVEQPVSISASGIITGNGTWTAVDDDEIIVSVDPMSIQVTVDSSAVVLNYNVLSMQDQPDLTSLKPAVAEHVRQQILLLAGQKLTSINKIDDIKIKDNLMSCEIGKKDMTLRRQVAL